MSITPIATRAPTVDTTPQAIDLGSGWHANAEFSVYFHGDHTAAIQLRLGDGTDAYYPTASGEAKEWIIDPNAGTWYLYAASSTTVTYTLTRIA